LEAKIASGDTSARGELHRLKNDDKAKEGANEIGALAGKLKAQRALKEGGGGSNDEAFKEEQQRVAEAKRQRELEEKKKADDSKAKLAARAALFGNTTQPTSPKLQGKK